MSELFKKDEKKVEYLELIYDLIFVFIIGKNNSLLHHTEGGRVQPGMFLAYILCTLAVIQIWNFSAYYINMFGKNGLREHIFLFSNMFMLYFIAEGTSADWEAYHTQYHIAWALILLNIALQYVIELRHAEGGQRAMIRNVLIILLIEAALVLGMIPLYRLTGTELSYLPIIVGIVSTFIAPGASLPVAVNFEHLTERAMLYVVFTFGEMVIAVGGYFDGELSVRRVYFCIMAFLIVVGLFLSYGTVYDHIIDRGREDNGLLYMLFHVFLIFGLNTLTTSLEFMQEDLIELMPKMLSLIGSFLMFYVFLMALVFRYSKTGCRPGAGFYAGLLALAASFAALMLVFRDQMLVNIALSAAYVFIIYAVIYRIGKFNKNASG